MAEIENLSEDVRRRRWNFIGHIMRKELQNDCGTGSQRGGENREDQGQHGEGRRREKGKKRDGRTGAVRYKWQRRTDMVGLCGIVLRPYVPHGTKMIGNR